MYYSRRILLKQLLFASAGVTFLPGCVFDSKKASTFPLKNFKITGTQEVLLAEITETILPKTDTPGAKELGLPAFVLTMVDDCSSKEDQAIFVAGLEGIEKLTQDKLSKSFIDCDAKERELILGSLTDKTEGVTHEMVNAYSSIKNLTIWGFTGSEYVMTNFYKFEFVPGRFHGCVPVTRPSHT